MGLFPGFLSQHPNIMGQPASVSPAGSGRVPGWEGSTGATAGVRQEKADRSGEGRDSGRRREWARQLLPAQGTLRQWAPGPHWPRAGGARARGQGAPCGPGADGAPRAHRTPALGPQLERARAEAGEALSAVRRLQRRVSELEEESRLQEADVSGASLQSELAHSLDGEQDQTQVTVVHGGSAVSPPRVRPFLPRGWAPGTALTSSVGEQATPSPDTQEQPRPQLAAQESLEPPRKRASQSATEMLVEKEAEVALLQDEVGRAGRSARAPPPSPSPTDSPLPSPPFTLTNLSCFRSSRVYHLLREDF